MAENNFLHYVISEYQILRELFYDPALTLTYQKDIFFHSEARSIYDAIRLLYETTGGVTEIDVLREASKANEKITPDIIKQIVSLEKSVETMDKLIESARESGILLRAKDWLMSLSTRIQDKNIDALTLSTELYNLQKLTSDMQSGRVRIRSIDEWLDEYILDLDRRKIGNYQVFNDTYLDSNLTRKAEPGQIILIAGATGNGKSAYCLNLINGLINCEQPVIYFSLEMDGISTLDRLLSIRTEIPISDWYGSGNDIDALYPKVEEERKLLRNKPFLFTDEPTVSLTDIESVIRKFKAKYGISRCIVFIDLITMASEFVTVRDGKSFATTIELACNRLNEIAKNENVCVVAIAQFGRNADNTKLSKIDDLEKLRPTLNDVKNSNALAERSRVVISVFRPYYYAKRYLSHLEDFDGMEDFLEIQILKQSQGNVHAPYQYMFKAECTKILPVITTDSNELIHF